MPEQTIMVSRAFLIRAVCAFLGISIVFGIIVAIPWLIPHRLGSAIRTLCWLEVGVGIIGAIFVMLFYAKSRPGLTLGPDGLTFWRAPMSNISFSWSDVENVQDICEVKCVTLAGFPLYRFFMPSCLTVHVVDSAKSQNPFFVYNRLNGLGDMVISSAQLGMTKKDLADLIDRHRIANRNF